MTRRIANLGLKYEKSDRVEQSIDKAVYWFTKSAEQNYIRAQLKLGAMYVQGNKIAEDPKKAEYWIRKAAEQGDSTAQYMYGILCEEGTGMAKDTTKAKQWYQKAAANGNEDAKAAVSRLQLVGKWKYEEYSAWNNFEFFDDGTYNYISSSGKRIDRNQYRISGNTISYKDIPNTNTFVISDNGNTLKIIFPSGDSGQYKRVN